MKIKVFTSTTCAYCVMVKRYLDSKKQAYETVNIEEQPEAHSEAYSKSGVLSVPVTIVTKDDGTERVIVGYNLSSLAQAIA